MQYARTCALLCRYAYDPGHLDPRIQVVDGAMERALVLDAETVCYVAFRGTLPKLAQWVDNVNAPKFDSSYGFVHYGFLSSFMNLSLALSKIMPAAGKPLVLTGHSRGGALAQYAVPYFASQGYPIKEVQLFGTPRMYSREAATAYDALYKEITFRWRHNNDTVCGLPPQWQGFKSVGRRNYIFSNGKVLLDDSKNRHMDRLWGRLKSLGRFRVFDGIGDHDMEHYLKAVFSIPEDGGSGAVC